MPEIIPIREKQFIAEPSLRITHNISGGAIRFTEESGGAWPSTKNSSEETGL